MSQLSILASGPRIFCAGLDVVADAGGAPHVVGAVIIAGVVGGELAGHDRPGVGEVGQLRLVELQEDFCRDLALQEIAGGHHDVVARFSRQQPRLQRLVGVERVVDHLDAGFLGEILQHSRRHIVRPVVEIDRAFLGSRAARASRAAATAPNRRSEIRSRSRISATFCGGAPRRTGAPARYPASRLSWKNRTAPPTSPHPVRRKPTPGSRQPCNRSRCACRTPHRFR